jgi:hypothetical protein
MGVQMGGALALGMGKSESEVERAARSLADTAIDSVSGVQNALSGDAWAADFNARVNGALATNDSGGSIVGELRALRGDASQSAQLAQLIAELRGLRRDVASGQLSAGADAQLRRTMADLGAW